MPESAIGALARTWSTPYPHNDTPRSTAGHGGQPSISKLPVELLLIIFQLVYENQIRRVAPWMEAEVALPSLFPYALAAVCVLWRDVMSMVPAYWTRVVIFLDPPTTPVVATTSLLTWSRDLPLDITLTRQNFKDPVDATHERTYLRSVLNILQSVINRIQDLHIYVKFSSSVPSFPDEFHGHASIMEILEVQCKEDNGGYLRPLDDDQPPNSPEHRPLQCPKLAHIALDGRNCYNAVKRNIRCTDMAQNLESFHVHQYKPQPGESFSAYDLLHPLVAIGSLEFVTIDNVAFDPNHRGQEYAGPRELQLYGLDIRDCHDFEDIAEIYRILGGVFMSEFMRCAVEPPIGTTWDFDMGEVLRLMEISADQDLVPLLCMFNGYYLAIRDCPGFDDDVLAAMSIRENGEFTCAPGLTELDIGFSANNYPAFSVAALKQFVERRIEELQELEEADPENDGEQVGPVRFPSIDVSGNAPYLSREDRAWFVERTETFRYPET